MAYLKVGSSNHSLSSFPKMNNIKYTLERMTNGGSDYNVAGTTETAAVNYNAINCEVGNTIFVTWNYLAVAYRSSGSGNRERKVYSALYQSTASVSQGATSSLGTRLAITTGGRVMENADNSGNDSYDSTSISGFFVATAKTHYVGIAIFSSTADVTARIRFEAGGEAIVQKVIEMQGG